MAYLGRSPSQGVRNRYYKTASGGETSISGALTGGTLTFTDGNYVDVNLNGLTLVAGTDYNTSTANTISGLSALTANDVVEIVVYDVFSVFSGNVNSDFSIGGNLSVTGTTAITGNADFAAGIDVTGDITATGTVEPAGDTSAGDNAAIGYTAAEGLILTGQGSTSDITFKNDADTTVFSIPTGTDDILFPDNAKAMFGDSSDLQISHNGSNSVIEDLGTGNLKIKSNGSGINFQKGDAELLATMATDGAVTLYHDSSAKLATASTGVDITGGVTATDTCTFSSANNVAQLILKSTDADADSGPQLDLTRDSGSPADGDSLGLIRFMFDNDAGQSIVASQLETSIVDASDSTEDGRLIVRTMTAGTSTSRLDFTNTETVFNDSSIDVDFRVESNGNDKMIFVDGENDYVGIGGTPNVLMHVIGPAAQVAIDTTSGGEPLLRFRENGTTRGLLKMDGTNTMEFHTGPDGAVAEVGSFQADGDFLVGKTSDTFATVGTALKSTGEVNMTRDGAAVLSIRRNTNAGNIIEFYADSTTIGMIGESADALYIGSYDTGLVFQGYFDDAISPFSPSAGNIRDNAIDLGYASSRFDDIYATNGTIQTSDENEKQDIASLTSAEITAAKAISKLFKTFKWKDKVVAKGDAARIHTGVVAQQVQKAMSDAGLDATKYAFWCSNTWKNDDGNEQTRMGVRYPELLAFIGAATEQRLADIETRLAALESKVS